MKFFLPKTLALITIGVMGCLILGLPMTQAISSTEIYGLNVESDDPVYGLVDTIFLYPDEETLDTSAELSFSYQQGNVAGFTESTLGIYKYDTDAEDWEYIGGEVDTSANTVVAAITETGQYAMAPAVPSGTITFEDDSPSLTFNGSNTKTLTTETIYNNDGSVVEDGESFTATLSNGTILTSDIESADGKVSVQIQSSAIAEDALLTLTSEFEKATGEVTINAVDAGDPDAPTNLEISESDDRVYLYWDESTAEDVVGYNVYYRESGAAGWSGEADEELPSPIEVLVGADYYQLHLNDNTDYDLHMKAIDAAGNESNASSIISFSTGDLDNFDTDSASAVDDVETSGLSDISGHWAETYIDTLVSWDAVQGYSDNTFLPDNEINRAEALKILLEAVGFDTSVASPSTLSDVPTGSWFEPYVSTAVHYEIVQGYSDNTFKPEQSITRAEFVKIVGALLEIGGDEVIPEDGDEPFDDVSSADWFQKYVAFFYNSDIVSGYDATHFMPGNPITRAEVSKIIVATFEAF